MILFSDPYELRGGGQVCLEYMLQDMVTRGPQAFGLVMPPAGRNKISIPGRCQVFDSRDDYLRRAKDDDSVVVISNANRGFPRDLQFARRLRNSGRKVRTVAIVHNYPLDPVKSAATRASLSLYDTVIVDEPGLTKLSKRAIAPAWVAPVIHDAPPWTISESPVKFTGIIKSFGRPDPSKGLHYLPAAFRELSGRGLNCRVALGNSLEGNEKYTSGLTKSLAPWLEEGYRTQEWINPGDIFIVPSIGGETTCQAAQEALLRGAYLVATRIGVLPYMCPEGGGISVVPMKDSSAIVHAVITATELGGHEFDLSVRRSASQIIRRSGRYYDEIGSMFYRFVSEF
ncbi:Glycosyl transferases group 1 [Propionibacterium cyclohexanicum]|uniref:Glycosyl transferases group 1 n=1 Tax=Propionibacterium cyclohexanicum TaxID=64702 RepID=A0A1H9R313_9ACTN|nr:glycosyltransferase [Propionibacterium cyclohexanicum]SER67090.1 Glycosyl transferases group 1 [Propionibacterium cyclohexanicum]